MASFFEMLMVVCFGVSWPLNIARAWRAKTARGVSVLFYFFIWIGYLFGLTAKLIAHSKGIQTPGYVWFFYILNTLMVSCGILVYFRNRRLDRQFKSNETQKA